MTEQTATKTIITETGLSMALFFFALAPRLIGLQSFVTADEAKWVYRSAQFWLAFLNGDWAGTMVKLKPAVTTMWTGGLGLWVYNRFHQNLPFDQFLSAIPEWRVDPAMLHSARMPTILLACASIVLVYQLLRPNFGRWHALFAGALLALSPLYLAHSRFLHHDALMALFALPSLLLAVQSVRGGWTALVFSAILGGLAFLTKSPIFFLAPFVGGLFLLAPRLPGPEAKFSYGGAAFRFVVWGFISYLTYIILWPAAWVSPLGAPLAVILDALNEAAPAASALPGEESSLNLGPFYYPVYFAFYATPVTLIGLIVWLIQRKGFNPAQRFTLGALFWFFVSFIIFMTFSDKRSARYILPAFMSATLIAGLGWSYFLARRKKAAQMVGAALLLALQLLAVVPYAPYYISYTNPLLGGPLTASRLIKLGWGEGMNQAGAWLNAQPHPEALRVGAAYASTLTPYFAGTVSDPNAANLDYIVSYIRQRQSDSPPAPILSYYEQILGSAAEIRFDGLDYARIYPGPAAQIVEGAGDIFAFRPETTFIPLGQTWTVDLIWQTSPAELPLLTLENDEGAFVAPEPEIILQTPEATVSRHTFSLPETALPASYTLLNGETSLGQFEAAYAQLPSGFQPVSAQFGDEIALQGWKLNEEPLRLSLAFGATPKAWADYTVYVHLIDEAGNRLAGHDAQPARPTSQWRKGEVVPDVHPLDLPADLPPGEYRFRVGLYRADNGEALGEGFVLPALWLKE